MIIYCFFLDKNTEKPISSSANVYIINKINSNKYDGIPLLEAGGGWKGLYYFDIGVDIGRYSSYWASGARQGLPLIKAERVYNKWEFEITLDTIEKIVKYEDLSIIDPTFPSIFENIPVVKQLKIGDTKYYIKDITTQQVTLAKEMGSDNIVKLVFLYPYEKTIYEVLIDDLSMSSTSNIGGLFNTKPTIITMQLTSNIGGLINTIPTAIKMQTTANIGGHWPEWQKETSAILPYSQQFLTDTRPVTKQIEMCYPYHYYWQAYPGKGRIWVESQKLYFNTTTTSNYTALAMPMDTYPYGANFSVYWYNVKALRSSAINGKYEFELIYNTEYVIVTYWLTQVGGQNDNEIWGRVYDNGSNYAGTHVHEYTAIDVFTEYDFKITMTNTKDAEMFYKKSSDSTWISLFTYNFTSISDFDKLFTWCYNHSMRLDRIIVDPDIS